MIDWLSRFERVARNAYRFTEKTAEKKSILHPFGVRDIHNALPSHIMRLFDNGHYSQATFEAFKYLDNLIKKLSGLDKTGKTLMTEALKETQPIIILADMATATGRSEQEGYKFLFAGSMMAIRNPRGHEHSIEDDMNTCLDYLSFVSLLLRRLEQSGYTVCDA
jgi:uncharacterized protein (TIGR02391 family)